MNNEKVVLILEKQSPVTVIDEENFVMEGNAAVFGVENENHRVYEEEEYMPHLKYLQEKIKRKKLSGEMDHPEKFETSLKNISHLVEKLWYDKDSRTLKCRIRLLDTDPHGLNARKLVKAGYPLSLSSRAAGVVQEDKSVKIKRIFAYDLVADGGFGDKAEMARVNESLGFDVGDLSKTDLSLINEELGIENDDLSVYDVTEKYKDYLNEDADFSNLDNEKNNDSDKIYNKNKDKNTMSKSVSVEEMYKYSLVVKEEMDKISKDVKSIQENLTKISENEDAPEGVKVAALEQEIANLKEQNNSLNERLETAIAYTEKIAEQSNKGIEYSEELAEHIVANRQYSEKIGEFANQNINYTEKVAENLNQLHNYSQEVLREHLNNSLNFSNKLSEHLNGIINYSENIGEKFNYLAAYAEKIGNTTNNVMKYTTYLAKHSVVKEDFENFINYSEEMFENKTEEDGNKVNENKETNLVKNYKSLGEKIDAVLEKIKTTKMEKNADETKFPFVKDLNETQQETFKSLNEAQKSKAAQLILTNQGETLNEEAFNKVIETATDKNDKWLTEMPEELKGSWDALDEVQKDKISRKAKWYNLNTEYQIRNFWRNQKLEEVEEIKPEDNKINESKKTETTKNLGYSSDYIKKIGKGLDRF